MLMKHPLKVLFICILLFTGCQKTAETGHESKDLPPYCMGLMNGDQSCTGNPYMCVRKDTVRDSLYSVGFYFHFRLSDSFSDNRITRYYGTALIIEEHDYLWSIRDTVLEEEIVPLFHHSFQKIYPGYYDSSYTSSDTSVFYIQYYFEIECLYKYDRELPPIIPMDHHYVKTIFTLI